MNEQTCKKLKTHSNRIRLQNLIKQLEIESIIFISPDQSPQADDQHKLARKTILALKEVCPDRVFRYVRRTAMVKSGAFDIASPVCESRENQGVKWHSPNLGELGIDKTAVLAKLDTLRSTTSSSSASGSQWPF